MEKICGSCSGTFHVEEDDRRFYHEIDVHEPAQCPACRSQERCMHRNERVLYKRTCDLCQAQTVAMYAADVPFPVYCPSCFYSDRWNALAYGKTCDPDHTIFEQLAEFYRAIPHLAIMNKQSQNSDYCNYSYANKNCYLTAGSHYEEDCLFGAYSTKNKDCLDCLWCYGSELLYECMFSKNCYQSQFLDHCEDCHDCLFSMDLKGCAHCLFSTNLRQKEYCVFNEEKSKEEYTRILTGLQLHTFSGIEGAKRTQRLELPRRFPVQALYQVQCEDCQGDTLSNCKNMRQCFYCSDSEDCAYGIQVDGTYSSMDTDYMGYDRSERCYQTIGCLGLFDCLACNACWNGSGLRYCQYCFSCTDCFGCMGLQQQTRCIFNKQYTQEDYQALLPQITAHMKGDNEWGTFFAASLSPFAYNESMAQDWSPLAKKTALSLGFHWKEDEELTGISKIIDATLLPESIDDIPDDVLNWALRCALTRRPFRIVKKELDFYRSQRLPLPHVHPDERHRQRKALRNPHKLWERICAKCSKAIKTTYAPDRPETVYCESCYLEFVY